MFRDQHAGQDRNLTVRNKIFERVKQFRNLGTTKTIKNLIYEEIKSRLKSQYACYCSE